MKRRAQTRAGIAGLTALVLVATACATSAGDESAPATQPVSTNPTESSDDVAPSDPVVDEVPSTDEPIGDDAPQAAPDVDDTVPVDDAPDAAPDAAPDEPPPTAAPAQLGGRPLAAEASAESAFDANPFPDLVVDDVGRDTAANLANLLPSDRPVLIWAWAPH